MSDLYALLEAGHADAGTYLDLSRQLAGETELVVWTEASEAFREIDDLERGSPDRDGFRAYAEACSVRHWTGSDGTPSLARATKAPMLRALLIRTLGRFDDKDVIAEARRRFAGFVREPASLSPNLQEAVMGVVGHVADRQTYDQLRQLGHHAANIKGTEGEACTLLQCAEAPGVRSGARGRDGPDRAHRRASERQGQPLPRCRGRHERRPGPGLEIVSPRAQAGSRRG